MAKKDLIIFGAGGLGREIAWQIEEWNKKQSEYNVIGFVDDTPEYQGTAINGLKVLGNTEYLLGYEKKVAVAICLGKSQHRQYVYNKIKGNRNLYFPTIIADNVRYGNNVKFGQGCIICWSAVITVDTQIGDFVLINYDCTIGHDVTLENFVTLYPSVNVSGNVKISYGVEIGVGSQIIEKKKIGENTILGAGAVVVDDIPANCTAVGVPAKVIKYHDI